VVGLTVAVRVTRGRVGSRFGALFWCCGSPCPHIHTAASSVSFPSTVCDDAPWATSEILIYRCIQATLLKNRNIRKCPTAFPPITKEQGADHDEPNGTFNLVMQAAKT
jgi:hypothetical protein